MSGFWIRRSGSGSAPVFLIFESLRAGAHGYILKNTTPTELIQAVEQVHAGGAPMSMYIARKVVNHFQQISKPSSEMEKLTKREQEVVALIAEGYRTREMAELLSVSHKTVERHRTNLMRKLGVRSATGVVA